MLSGALIGFAALGIPQEGTPGVSGPDAIATRQASMDMSVITLRSMGDSMKAGAEAKSQGFPAAVLAKWAKALPRMFPSGTGKGETSANTQALPAIGKTAPASIGLLPIMRPRPPGWLPWLPTTTPPASPNNSKR